MDLARIHIERVIVHDVPRRLRSSEDASPILSDGESPIDDGLRVFFQEKIRESASAANAFGARFAPDSTSPVPRLVTAFLDPLTSDIFVDMSRQVAQHLNECQTGVNPGGLVTVSECRIGESRALAVLKLEREEGVRVERRDAGAGHLVFDLERVRDLMLTQKTKLFKFALFGGTDPVEILVCDKQLGYRPSMEVANFFLRRFLGCELLEAPQVTTKPRKTS